jgi:hypothetical protein
MILPNHNQTLTRRTGRLAASWCAALLIASLPAHTFAAGASASEYAIKAAIIFKIAKFVSWPEQAFSGQSEPLTVCVQNNDPIAAAMSELNGKLIHGRVFSVHYIDENTTKHNSCQILFLSNTHREKQQALLNEAVGQPVLTIGDSDKFISQGGIIELNIAKNHVHFSINVAASETSGLNISAQLLQLAVITEKYQGT